SGSRATAFIFKAAPHKSAEATYFPDAAKVSRRRSDETRPTPAGAKSCFCVFAYQVPCGYKCPVGISALRVFPAPGKQVAPADLCGAALKINAVALLPLVMGRGKVQTLNAFLKLYRTDKNETAGSFVSAAVAVRPSAVREIAILLAVFAVDFYKLPML
ncbi:MAG: hypothetical protein LUF77_04425, partial [Oscillospiraceae bacterium]|nr:hypothetical protein [Oscillospiraceae bacterium]